MNEKLTQINFNYLNPSNNVVACYPSEFCLSGPYRLVPVHCLCSETKSYCLKMLSVDGCLKLCYHESKCCWRELLAYQPWILNHLLGGRRDDERKRTKSKNQINARIYFRLKKENSRRKIEFSQKLFWVGNLIKEKIELRGTLETSREVLTFYKFISKSDSPLDERTLSGHTITWINLWARCAKSRQIKIIWFLLLNNFFLFERKSKKSFPIKFSFHLLKREFAKRDDIQLKVKWRRVQSNQLSCYPTYLKWNYVLRALRRVFIAVLRRFLVVSTFSLW